MIPIMVFWLVPSSCLVVSSRRVRLLSKPRDNDEEMLDSLETAFRRVASDRAQREIDRLRSQNQRELGMGDRRVQSAQEPQNELREMTDGSNWGTLGLGGMLGRFAGVCGAGSSISLFFVENYDTYNELVDLTTFQKASLPIMLGAVVALFSAFRLLGQWTAIAERLSSKNLYFEQTGWADGFTLDKPDNTAFRDQLLYEDEVVPRVGTIRSAFAIVLASSAAALAAFVLAWVVLPGA